MQGKNFGKNLIIKADGTKESFDPEKLHSSLQRAGASRATCERITKQIQSELKDGETTREIYNRAFTLLKESDATKAYSYSLRRAVADLGPTGFPFEKFIAEIFKARGYTTRLDQIVQGKCISHEVDLVAFKGDDLQMVEAKFHNDFGFKSDAKVALYTRARFDDLAKATYDCDGRVCVLGEGYLITNTKFSKTAIKYGKCENLKMVGWNYPDKGNLQDMIEEFSLHPVTALTTIKNDEKGRLFEQGVVACRSVTAGNLDSVGITGRRLNDIRKEIGQVCVKK